MKISMNQVAANVKEAGSSKSFGITNAKFKGMGLDSVPANPPIPTLGVKWELENGYEYTYHLFEPKSSERGPGFNNIPSPSQVEQFVTGLMHVLDTVNPEIANKIKSGEANVDLPFDKLCEYMAKVGQNFIGKTTQLKFLPEKGFPEMKRYPANIDKFGNLRLQTKFIGDNLTLSAYEIQAIEKAKTAVPTNMNQNNDTVETMANQNEIDDLPF